MPLPKVFPHYSSQYYQVEQEAPLEVPSIDTPFLNDHDEKAIIQLRSPTYLSLRSPVWFWAWLSTIVIFSTYALMNSTLFRTSYSYEHGFVNELRPGVSEIELEQVLFVGGLIVNSTGSLLNTDAANPVQYAGPPSREIDIAWGRLLKGQVLTFSGDEAESLKDMTVANAKAEYHVVMDWAHQLHCLNKLRKALYPEYYNPSDVETPVNRVVHLDHCINYLRQSIMCKADMTPIPFRLNNATRSLLPDFENVHTCRNFDKVREWGESRRSEWDVEEIVE
ncbi:hypothetical protein VTL71DRAFT_159 [Oculimacula yallundae]|uniref:Uncharacterized protein n=1 Tax=Oculimacula yallundae TaxID=86028 RepID=A0ABR4CZB9_9HELO